MVLLPVIIGETLATKWSDPVSTADLKGYPCPHCHSENVKVHRYDQTQNNGEIKLYLCQNCNSYFAETYGSAIAGLTTHFSLEMGAPAKSFRMALGALIIKDNFGITDRETVDKIRDNPY